MAGRVRVREISDDEGVVTGIVQEFQFGMNWSNYSVFVAFRVYPRRAILGATLMITPLPARGPGDPRRRKP